LGNKRILIVDDDESVLKTMARILELEGYQVDTARTGMEAVKKSRVNFYHLALIDIRLPDMQGTKLLTSMCDTIPRMVKILVTGYPSMNNAIEAVNKGADSYLRKPVKMDELLNVVRDQLRKQQEQKEYSEQKVAEYVETRIKELQTEELAIAKPTE